MYWSKPFTKIPSWLNKFDHKIITLLGILTMGGFYTKPVQAENFPPPEILEQLKENILQDVKCVEPCATFSKMTIQVNDQNIQIEGEVHAQEDAAIAIPGSADTIHISKVDINGKNTLQLRRHNNFVLVRVPKGVHNISVEGMLPNKNVITIPIQEKHKAKYVI